MNFAKHFLFVAIASTLGLGLAGCQPSDPNAPTVGQLAAVTIAGGPVTLDVGGSASLVLTGSFSDGTEADVSFGATFTSSAAAVATVSPTGAVRGVAPGTATITATHSPSGKTATVSVTVSALRVTAIVVANAAPVRVAPNGTQQLTVTGTFNNATTGNVTVGSTFVSSNPAVATVGVSSGIVTGVTVGTATITVTHTASGKTATVAIEVALPPGPTVAAPTAPARAAGDVLSIYSDSYTPVPNINLFPNWGQSTVVSEVLIAGNRTQRYTNLNYEGIDWAANPIDVSGMTRLHVDFWTADITSLKVSIISAGAENPVTLTPTAGWNSVDIDLALYTVPNKAAIIQIKIEGTPVGGILYLDNIYFWRPAPGNVVCGTTAPTCAPVGSIPSGSTTIYSDATTISGFDPFPNWGQSPPVVSSEVTIASNKSLRYVWAGPGGLYQGLDWSANAVNVTTKGKLHIDFWTADITSVKVSIISVGAENFFTQSLTARAWNGVDIDLSNYTVPNKAAIIQIKLEPLTAGTLYVDNVYFWGTPGGGTSGCAEMGCAGAVTLPLATANDALGFIQTGEGVYAGDYIGPLDSNNLHALFAGATTTGASSGGTVGYFNDALLSSSSQKLEEGGWVSGSIDQPGVPNFFRYFVLTAPASTFSSSYMGLFVNARSNGTVNVSSFASIKFRLWGPAQMYEQGNFNPVLEMTLSGPKVTGCVSTGSGGTEISKTFIANQKIGAASTYKVALSGWTVKGVCGTDTNGTAVAAVLANLARVSFTAPAAAFNFINANTGSPVSYSTGINLGPVAFTNN